uniref:Integrase catalytic domain-containing protein n=1 Tax=Cacopsylla melanoneura TaxID=428564 RepID=A0A8D9FC82_9HEMI
MSHVDFLSRNPIESEIETPKESIVNTTIEEQMSTIKEVNHPDTPYPSRPSVRTARPHGKRSNYTSARVKLKRVMQTKLHFIATGACRANGQVERQMRVLKNMLTVAETEENKSWQQSVGDVQLAINTAPHRVTKSSPMELMFGRVSRPRGLIVAEGDIADNSDVDLKHN